MSGPEIYQDRPSDRASRRAGGRASGRAGGMGGGIASEIEGHGAHSPRRGRAEPIGFTLPTGSDPASVRARVTAMEALLERSFKLPGVNLPIGLDALIGLIPVLGDIVTTALGAYMVWEARNLGMSKWHLTRMGANVAFDTIIGLIPVVGDAADFVFRSNTRNLRIIKKHLDKHHPETRIIEG